MRCLEKVFLLGGSLGGRFIRLLVVVVFGWFLDKEDSTEEVVF